MAKGVLHKNLSEEVVRMFIEVSRKYGHLHKEKVYQKACAEWSEQNNLPYISQPRIDIVSLDTGKKFTTYIPDFLIDKLMIIELKAQDYLPKKLIAQLEQYLKASKYEVGYLVNFGKPRAEWYRRIYTNDLKPHISEPSVSDQ